MTKDGWLEEGDKVNAGDYVLMGTGELMQIDMGGYVHKDMHNPKWRPPAMPNRTQCMQKLKHWLIEQEMRDFK